ncbi:UNVERIFIED_ASMBLY: hypothetical protein SD1_05 [Shigella phage 2019SD1]|uniref:Uncharacterized protein n=1 Tax=Shigella phage 2019SD1 TaxID=2848074 RepID=A0A6M5C9R4_9CAUD|nr:hypothetical protein H1N84_gp05 [Shigella phage 2019SD1]
MDSCIYEDGDPVNVVSIGNVWCLTSESEAPEYGDKVFVTPDGDASYSEGDLLSGWFFTGDHCGDEFIAPGKIVRLSHITNGYKIASVNGGLVIGVAVRPPDSCIYEDGDPVNVVSIGNVWCLTSESEAPEYGDKVFVTPDGDASYSEGDLLSGWFFTGDHIKTGPDSYIVGVSFSA